jgi:uncharacterized sodium:solute symporter family permease YidK
VLGSATLSVTLVGLVIGTLMLPNLTWATLRRGFVQAGLSLISE